MTNISTQGTFLQDFMKMWSTCFRISLKILENVSSVLKKKFHIKKKVSYIGSYLDKLLWNSHDITNNYNSKSNYLFAKLYHL